MSVFDFIKGPSLLIVVKFKLLNGLWFLLKERERKRERERLR